MVGSGEKSLEVCPGLDVRWLASTELAFVVKETSLEHKLKSNSNNLGWGVWHVSGGGVVNRIFDLIDQGFERLIAVVGISESLVLVLYRGGGNVSVCRAEMVR